MSAPIRVLIVDDSAVMRTVISQMLSKDTEIEIAGTARNGQHALEQIRALDPDVVTLDVEMPVMDGLQALRHIMRAFPRPVIMFSSLTTEGAEATLEALQTGAVDFLPKNYQTLASCREEVSIQLCRKIKFLVRHHKTAQVLHALAGNTDPAPGSGAGGQRAFLRLLANRRVQLALIGSSTGGPQTLHQIIPQLPSDMALPIIVIQHMPANFTHSLAERLNRLSAIRVCEARDNDPVYPGTVYIAPGGQQLVLAKPSARLHLRVRESDEEMIYRPSVNVTAGSIAEQMPGAALGIMLTGMGRDGLEGFIRMKQTGDVLIAQSAESCIIYGMPRAIVEAGIADCVLPVEGITGALLALDSAAR